MMKSMRPFALLSLCAGLSVACTVTAPPAEDLQGNGFNVEGGVLSVDDTKVPVVDECGDGQAVVKAGDGWACVALADGTVAGDGLTIDGDTISVDFGAGATQVASGASLDVLEDATIALDEDLSALDTRVTAAEGAITTVDGRVTNLDGTLTGLLDGISNQVDGLSSFFVDACDATTAGGLKREGDVLQVCDGAQFRAISLDAPAPAAVIADYHQDDVNIGATSWTNRVAGGAPLFLGTDVGRVLPPAPGVAGIGRLNSAAAGFAAPSGHGRLTLPARGFSIELVVSGSDTVFSHGQNDLQISFFGQMTVREHGRDSRYQPPPTAPDSNRPSHIVYVHEANDTRRLYLNGSELTLETDSSRWNGPYLTDGTLMALGSTFGAAGAGAPVLHHRVRIHGVPLNAAEVLLRCQASLAAPLNVQSCG